MLSNTETRKTRKYTEMSENTKNTEIHGNVRFRPVRAGVSEVLKQWI